MSHHGWLAALAGFVAVSGFQAHAGIRGSSWAGPPWIELAITSLAACWLLLQYLATRRQHSRAAGTRRLLTQGGFHQRPGEG
jgi:hypothetical protein